jgi:hypothetical protein
MYKDLMVDLETFDSGSNAVIVSIGAVVFNLEGNDTVKSVQEPERCWYSVIDASDQQKFGRTIGPSTVAWWLQQNEAARQALWKPSLRLEPALKLLNVFAKENEITRMWGYGATFDNVILNNACEAYGVRPIVSYRGNMCMRTIVSLSFVPCPVEAEGLTAHNALADAQRQVIWLQRAYRSLTSIQSLPNQAV